MREFQHQTIIRNLKINNLSKGASINYGSSVHKGYQANSKINTGELAIGDTFEITIGDSFTFGCPCPEEEV